MAQRVYRGVLVWAMGSLLMAGCATPSRPAAAGAGESQPAKVAKTSKPESGEVDKKQVEAQAHYAQALINDLNGESDLAVEEFAKSAIADPSNEPLIMELTRRYLRDKKPEKALVLLQKASQTPEASGAVFANLGMIYSQLGREQEAVSATQKAIQRAPGSLAGYQNLAIIHMQKGRTKDALKVLDQAAKVPDSSAEFLVDLAGLYVTLQREAPALQDTIAKSALQVLNRATKLEPANPRLSLKMADEYSQFGDSTNATKIYAGLLEKFGDLPTLRNDIHSKLADIYMRDHDPKKATEQLEAIIKEDPANALAYYYLGGVASEDRKLPAAADYYRKALLLNEEFEPVYYDLAGVQINLDKPKEALATLEQARSRFTRNFMSEFLAGLAYVRMKDFTNGVSHFTSAESLAKASEPARLTAFFYFESGAALERKGDFDEAVKYFEKSLQLAPDMPEALNYYGYMLAEKGIKLTKAREYIEKAVKQEPKNAAYLDSLGWVLFKLGKSEEGLVQIQKAVELSEELDATLFEHLGDIQASLKQMDKAREAWKKSLAIEPNEKIRQKLEAAGGNSPP